ncbi:MAG: hypothetical protein M1378_02605 [Bacteroidetes bacterium]|nr:hypothetical protein [Bacteroidota bacterium]
MKNSILAAVVGCRLYVLSIFLVYVISCTVGILMVHSGYQFALSERDKIVGVAVQTDKAALNYQSGKKFTAALYDFAGNLFIAAIPQTVIGLAIVPPYFTVAYQGWVGGIVSVDGSHQSRLTSFKSSVYYFIVLLLQFTAFSLSIGAGIKCGVDTYKRNLEVSWRFWKFRIPKESLADVGYVYLVSLPVFLAASSFEFLSSWNM